MPEAPSWVGMRIDDAYGALVGVVNDLYLEEDGSPRWIFTARRKVLIPAQEALVGAGRVWVPYTRDVIVAAPKVYSLDDLTPELETETRRWYASGKDHDGRVEHVRS